MFIFGWFGLEVDGRRRLQWPRTALATPWDSFGFIDIILFVTVFGAIGAGADQRREPSVGLPVALSVGRRPARGLGTLVLI